MAPRGWRAAALVLAAAWARPGVAAAAGAKADAVDLCKLSEELCGVTSYSGYVPIAGAGSLFYWYFPSEGAAPSAPLTLWLQGGPGSPDMLGLIYELGPVTLAEGGVPKRRAAAETWATHVPLLFVDSPVGTGWSFAEGDDGYARNQTAVAATLHAFLLRFRELHPEVPTKLFVAGESYGGHYIPALSAYMIEHPGPFTLEAVAIGDGLTDPETQVLTKPHLAYSFGLIDEKQLAQAQAFAQAAHDSAVAGDYITAAARREDMESLVMNISGINPYDVRTTENYDWQDVRLQQFFSQNATKDALHIPRERTFGTSDRVGQCLAGDVMRSQKGSVEKLLIAGVKVMLYQGQFDWKDGVVSNEAWIQTLQWPGAEGWLNATRTTWRRACDGQIAGYWRRWHNLEQVVVLGAGHLVPMNQPLSAIDMVLRFLGLPQRAEEASILV